MKKNFAVVFMVMVLLVGCQLNPVVPERPPDQKIAFMTDRDGNFEVYTMEPDGSNLTNLTNSDSQEGLPAWSSTNKSFAYLTDPDGAGLAIFSMNKDGHNPKRLSGNALANFSIPVWSSTGEWLAFGGGDDTNPEVYITDIGGENVINLTNNPGHDIFAAWSPDGSKILFLSDRDGEIAIYSATVDGGEDPLLITDPQFGSGRPAWSPDGAKIALMSNRDGDIEIYVMDADGGNLVRLTDSPGFDGFPAWSPDGAKIAFLSGRDGNAEIYIMNPDGSDLLNLTNTPDAQESIEGDFSWSPDGTQILFHSNRQGDMEVYVMTVDGGNQTNLTNNPSTDFGAIWVK